MLQISLPILVRGSKQLQSVVSKVELFFAIYFLVDAIRIFIRWNLKKDYTSDLDITATINLVLYIYIMIAVAR